MSIYIDSKKCPQNHKCPASKACPVGALIQEDGVSAPIVDEDKCIECLKCVKVCPMGAIQENEVDS